MDAQTDHPIVPDTLAKFQRFWTRHGVAGPDMTPRAPAPTENETLAAALFAQAVAITELAVQVRSLVERQTTPEELSGVLAAAVALAVRETLQTASVADGTRPT